MENGTYKGVVIVTTYFRDWKSTEFNYGDYSGVLTHPTVGTKNFHSAHIYCGGDSRLLVRTLGLVAHPLDVERSRNTKGVSGYLLHPINDFGDLNSNQIIIEIARQIKSIGDCFDSNCERNFHIS